MSGPQQDRYLGGVPRMQPGILPRRQSCDWPARHTPTVSEDGVVAHQQYGAPPSGKTNGNSRGVLTLFHVSPNPYPSFQIHFIAIVSYPKFLAAPRNTFQPGE